jgi:hypothetical protein
VTRRKVRNSPAARTGEIAAVFALVAVAAAAMAMWPVFLPGRQFQVLSFVITGVVATCAAVAWLWLTAWRSPVGLWRLRALLLPVQERGVEHPGAVICVFVASTSPIAALASSSGARDQEEVAGHGMV